MRGRKGKERERRGWRERARGGGSKRHSVQAVKLSQRFWQTDVHLVSIPAAPNHGCPIYRFLGKLAMQTRWMAGTAPHKSETNPDPTTTRNQLWICDICHRKIHGRKQISIRCNRIEHWVHLRCAGIRLAQYTDTCHLYK